MSEHLFLSGLYWTLSSFTIMCPTNQEMDDIVQSLVSAFPQDPVDSSNELLSSKKIFQNYIYKCYDSTRGGFGGNVGQDAHVLYTLSALQILILLHYTTTPIEDEDNKGWLDTTRVSPMDILSFISSLQRSDGSFVGDHYGEIDTRFSYCALYIYKLLIPLVNVDDNTQPTKSWRINVEKAVQYIQQSCSNSLFDGGYGSIPGAESHAGQIFCCIASLAMTKSLHLLDSSTYQLLGFWLSERQCDSGGLNGRPEKQADVCYSWWILSSLSILDQVSWIHTRKLEDFILKCQDDVDGGIADRPGDMPDVFHTFFGIAGLSLLNYLHGVDTGSTYDYRKIDSIYALPTDVVRKMGLPGQVYRHDTPHSSTTISLKMNKHSYTRDERLDHYDTIVVAHDKSELLF